MNGSTNTASAQFFPGFLSALEVLEPYLDTLVLAGGWVPFAYHYHLGRSAAERAPLTRDIDIVVPKKIPLRRASIDALLKKAGLDCEFRSISEPPVTAYVGRIGEDVVEVEFLTHAPGDSEDIVEVQPGLTAQSLHYMNLHPAGTNGREYLVRTQARARLKHHVSSKCALRAKRSFRQNSFP